MYCSYILLYYFFPHYACIQLSTSLLYFDFSVLSLFLNSYSGVFKYNKKELISFVIIDKKGNIQHAKVHIKN